MSHISIKLCLLLLSLVYAIDDNCLIAIIEETVQIPCSLDTYEPLKREDISVGWETYEGLIVHTFKKGKDYLENQDSKFKGRTQLFLPELPRGNFTLRLSDVSLTDEGEYVCRYYRIGEKSSSNLSHQCLQVAGRYSDPIVHGPASPVLKDSEVNFTCKSTGGYPKPKIQWSVNKEPFQDSSRVDTRLSKDSRERYNVTSILTVNMTEKVTVSCSVENEKLRDKRASPETEYLIKTEEEEEQDNITFWVVVGVAVAIVVVVIGEIVKYNWGNQHQPPGVLRLNVRFPFSSWNS
ncbi:CD276 antigen homolog [Polypterus senegalus]|uniref:CD276 antigen homolog n=1 Tax=Polypterus senegalus TaxID=55291 RepID=UPI0019656F23|nr:CD276 antigen homolog [Polypterus senegalus]